MSDDLIESRKELASISTRERDALIRYQENHDLFEEIAQETKIEADGLYEAIKSQGLEQLPNKPVILDVGCGNGEKILALDKLLQNMNYLPQLHLVEPSAAQRVRLYEQLQNRHCNVYNCKLDDIDFGNNQADIALFIHSLYQFPKKNGIPNIGISKLLTARGLVAVITQHEESDLFKMKSPEQKAFEVTPSKVYSALKQEGLTICYSKTLEGEFTINYQDKSNVELGELFAFLAPHKLQNNNVTQEFSRFGRYVREHEGAIQNKNVLMLAKKL